MYPFERFTERAKRVLTFAQEEAQKARHDHIGTEHLLLGLTRETDGVAARVLGNLGVRADEVRSRLEGVLDRDSPSVVIQQIVPTSRVKRMIELSFEESRRMGHRYVGTEHLLLGLLLEGEGIAAHLLQELHVTVETVRDEVEKMVRSGEIAAPVSGRQVELPFVSLHLGTILQRAREQAFRQGSGVTRLDHLLQVLVDEAGYQELTDLLDRRGVQWDPPEELQTLSSRLHQLASRNAEAAGRQQQETAAQLRDEYGRSRQEYMRAETAWLAPFLVDQPPP
jgi:ATP-dependent Clp protease ATP-binding subunit ClpA